MNLPPARWLTMLCVVLLIGCGAATPQATPAGLVVTATEFRFNPTTLAIKAGAPGEVTLKNSGQTLHDFAIVAGPGIPTPDTETGNSPTEQPHDRSYHVAAEAGTQATLSLNLPAGTYTFICTVAGHADLGMRGTLTAQ